MSPALSDGQRIDDLSLGSLSLDLSMEGLVPSVLAWYLAIVKSICSFRVIN